MEKSIYKALMYSDIFDYPLTGSQIFQFIPTKIKRNKLLSLLKKIPHKISGNTIYYFLPKREKLVSIREQREKISIKKIQKAKAIASVLSYIPTIRFIGISGSLALRNADKNSDIDLFFITSPFTVWISRFIVYVVLQVLGVRQKKKRYRSDAVCANMFIDQRHGRFPIKKRNLYLAHEIAQLLPIVNKDNSFEHFLYVNQWIVNYFPNIVLIKPKKKNKFQFSLLLYPLEYMLRVVQLWYMSNNKTRETTMPFLIAFHPYDYEKHTLSTYEKQVKKYGI